MRNEGLVWLLVAVVGAAAVWFGTGNGVGVSIDSMSYIRGAENIARHNGYALISDAGGSEKIDHWPPLYSIAIAIPIFAGLSATESVRLVNALSMFAMLYLSALLVRRLSLGTTLAPTLAMIGILAAPSIMHNHLMAWSEALFVPLLLLGLLKMLDYISSNRMRDLLMAGLCFGLGAVDRYSGAAFIAAVVVALVLYGFRDKKRATLVRVFAFCVVSGLPTVLWFARNYFVTHRAHDRAFEPRLLSVNHVRAAADSVSVWLLPAWVPFRVRLVWFAAVSLLAVIAVRAGSGRVKQAMARDLSHHGRFWALVGLCVAAYLGFVLVTISFFDYEVNYDSRMMSPMLVLLIILLAVVGRSLFARPLSVPAKLLAASIVVSVGLLAFQSAAYVQASRTDPAQYGGARWTQARAWDILRSSPAGTKIYSSSTDVVKYFVERRVQPFPVRPASGDGAAVASYQASLQTIADEVDDDGYLLFVFYPRMEASDVVLEEGARNILHASTVDSTESVVLYRIVR